MSKAPLAMATWRGARTTVLLALVALGGALPASGHEEKPAAPAKQEAEPAKIPLDNLLPGQSRWWRALSFTAEFLDQPNFFNTPDPANPGMVVSTPNPDDHLWEFTISLDLEKLFWSTSELASVYSLAAGKDTSGYIDATAFKDQYVLDRGRPLDFFARTRRGDRMRRFLSSFQLSTGQSERVEAMTSVSNMTNLGDEFEETYDATFDPKKLLLTTDRLKTAYGALESYTKVHNVKSGLPELDATGSDLQRPVEALGRLSGNLKVVRQSVAALLPTITYKTVDQFDLAEIGGQFIASDFVEGSIESITITWDLGDALNTAEQRRNALEALALHKKLRAHDEKFNRQLTIKPAGLTSLCVGHFYSVTLTADNAIGSVTWRADGLPKGLELGKSTGLLEGIASEKATVTVTATDARRAPSTPAKGTKPLEITVCH